MGAQFSRAWTVTDNTGSGQPRFKTVTVTVTAVNDTPVAGGLIRIAADRLITPVEDGFAPSLSATPPRRPRRR